MRPVKGHGAKFERKQEEAIAALLSHRSIEEAAREVDASVGFGIGRSTAWDSTPIGP